MPARSKIIRASNDVIKSADVIMSRRRKKDVDVIVLAVSKSGKSLETARSVR